MRLWSKWRWNIPYWVTSEVYAKSHDDQLATDRATARGIPSDAKSETNDEHEFLDISGQSNIQIYMIGSPLKYAPSPATIARPWTELQAVQFPQGRSYNRTTNMCSRSVSVKVMLKYTLLGHLWSICQVPRQSHVSGRSYKHWNSLRCEIRIARRTWDLARFWSKWHWNIHY